MWQTLLAWARCFNGPPLYRIFRSDETAPGRAYAGNALERHSDTVFHLVGLCGNFLMWVSPILLIHYYRRDALTADTALKYVWFFTLAGVGSWLLRGVGRLANRDYTAFARVYNKAMEDIDSPISRQLLHRYDFGFGAWPVDYIWQSEPKRTVSLANTVAPPDNSADLHLAERRTFMEKSVYPWVEWGVAGVVGRRIMYPGSVSLMNSLLKFVLDQGRAKLFEEHNARRYKLKTAGNNSIESVFVDKRSNGHNGTKLIICCEGNAGYLEIGVMTTPLELGFSTLGWNHPGFGGSEGIPWPDQEREAVEVVVQFALEELGFDPRDIVVSGWSIGGFTASWAVSRYPQLGGLFLDATFDDVLQLATTKMPKAAEKLVIRTIRTYLDLQISRQIQNYHGPVKFIRRSHDEVLSTTTSSNPRQQQATNRANDLLVGFLKDRYPNLIPNNTDIVWNWLMADEIQKITMITDLDDDDVMIYLDAPPGKPFPHPVGFELTPRQQQQLALKLAIFYMEDFPTTHCTPLEGRYFSPPSHPWELREE